MELSLTAADIDGTGCTCMGMLVPWSCCCCSRLDRFGSAIERAVSVASDPGNDGREGSGATDERRFLVGTGMRYAARISRLHNGQCRWLSNHGSTQVWWNVWPQTEKKGMKNGESLGFVCLPNCRTTSPVFTMSRQTTHGSWVGDVSVTVTSEIFVNAFFAALFKRACRRSFVVRDRYRWQ